MTERDDYEWRCSCGAGGLGGGTARLHVSGPSDFKHSITRVRDDQHERAEGFWWVQWHGRWEIMRVQHEGGWAISTHSRGVPLFHPLLKWGPYLGKEPDVETMLQACNDLLMQKRASLPVPKFGARIMDALREAGIDPAAPSTLEALDEMVSADLAKLRGVGESFSAEDYVIRKGERPSTLSGVVAKAKRLTEHPQPVSDDALVAELLAGLESELGLAESDPGSPGWAVTSAVREVVDRYKAKRDPL